MAFRMGLPFVCLFFAFVLFDGVKYPLLLVSAILIHEGGHILAARLVKAPLTAFSCGIHGLSLAFDFSTLSYAKECVILLAGSGAGLLSAAAVYGIGAGAAYFPAVSVALSLVNLLPIRGLDGGEVLSCLLGCFLLPDHAYRITKTVSWIAALLLWLAVLWIQLRVQPNLSLLTASVYLLLRADSQ